MEIALKVIGVMCIAIAFATVVLMGIAVIFDIDVIFGISVDKIILLSFLFTVLLGLIAFMMVIITI